jgi:diguanylate cyclase (GGDEF)-like protein
VLENLRKTFENEVFEFEGKEHKITITIGATVYEKDMTLEKWVSSADERMYLGKNSGKNKVVI